MKEQVYIESHNEILSEFLAMHLKQSLGYNCYQIQKYLFSKTNHPENANKTLYLQDCGGMGAPELREKIELEKISGNGQIYGLFNVALNVNSDIEIEAFLKGYKGFFFENTRLELLTKGIQVIFNGQVWFSRNVLNHVYNKIKDYMLFQEKESIDLTLREREILTLIAMGCQNKEIADRLCISYHTVKTHIYKIFRKIDVPNRLQAALWAANHRINS